jgi:hypothetical protein
MLFRMSSRGGSQDNVKYTQQFAVHKRRAQIKSPITKYLIDVANVKEMNAVVEKNSSLLFGKHNPPLSKFFQHENTTLYCNNNPVFLNSAPLVHCNSWSLLAFN